MRTYTIRTFFGCFMVKATSVEDARRKFEATFPGLRAGEIE